jgi:aminoglycoside phosphotransferase (APT) family kinase protein
VEKRLRPWLETRLGLKAPRVVPIEEGWDSSVFEVDGEWIVRAPRRPEVRDWMRVEAALLPALADALPVPIPQFAGVEDTARDFFVAYRKLEGEALSAEACRGSSGAPLAAQLASFLADLHAFPRERATAAGLPDVGPGDWIVHQERFAVRCVDVVVPLLAEDERTRAERMFEDLLSGLDTFAETVLIHADLGPAHLLHRGPSLTGVIDWSDARLGDPALDFAWLLHGTGEPFAEALLRAYGGQPDDALPSRALSYHRLGPWHEVLYGLENERSELVKTGLAGVRQRLPPA